MNHSHSMARQRQSVPGDIEEDSEAGRAARAALGKAAYDLNVQQYCCGGLNFGYYYDQSPLVLYDGEPQPPYTMAQFTPSTVPGCRTPHFWLADGRSLYDALGPDYTLIRVDPAAGAGALLARARARGIPIALLDVTPAEAGEPYRHKLLLSRPDQHVAWRGDAVPADVDHVLDVITGARHCAAPIDRPAEPAVANQGA